MKYVVLLGRIFYATLFIMASFGHFSTATVDYAASQGVPFPALFVPISGILALAGGLSILLGYKARIGGWLLVIFLLPVTFMMHKFWGNMDPMAATMQQIMFMKNLALLGTALMVAYFGSGPLSLSRKG